MKIDEEKQKTDKESQAVRNAQAVTDQAMTMIKTMLDPLNGRIDKLERRVKKQDSWIAVLKVGIRKLTDQLTAHGITPEWELPSEPPLE